MALQPGAIAQLELRRAALLTQLINASSREVELRRTIASLSQILATVTPPPEQLRVQLLAAQAELDQILRGLPAVQEELRALDRAITAAGAQPLPTAESIRQAEAAAVPLPTAPAAPPPGVVTAPAAAQTPAPQPQPIVVPVTINVPEAPPTPPDELEALYQQTEMMARQGQLGTLAPDTAIAQALAAPIQGFLKMVGLTPESLAALRASPADPEKAAQMAQGIALSGIGAMCLLGTVGIVAEIASLGQVEGVLGAIQLNLQTTGVAATLSQIWNMPFFEGMIKPATAYWRSVFTPEIPGAGDLIRFVVREVIGPEDFAKWMGLQGYSGAWSKAYWEAHWVLPSRGEVVAAYHRGGISAEERDRYLVWLDYSPTPRPGIAKSDLEILAGLQKTLMPRVDLRRGFELGRLSREDLEARFRWLGYEDDSPLMAEIQAETALEAERMAVARAGGILFRGGRLTEEQFRELLAGLKVLGERQDLWILRYQLERAARAKGLPVPEEAEQPAPAEAEEGEAVP